MRLPLIALCPVVLLALSAGCQDPVAPPPAETPTPTPTVAPTATPDWTGRTPPPNFFVQTGRSYTYRRTPPQGPPATVMVQVGEMTGTSYAVTITEGESVREERFEPAMGVFPLGLAPAGVPARDIAQYPTASVRVPAGTFGVRRVEQDGHTFDFSEEYGVLVRAVTVEAGLFTTIELMKAEPSRYRVR